MTIGFVWLLLVMPKAEPLVAKWRAEHDWAARFGIPAHVTVRSPFLPPEQWADPGLRTLQRLLPVPMTLARVVNRPGALVVVVEPDDQLRKLTDETTRAWPTLPPHKPDRPTFAYHVTVVRTEDPEVRRKATKAIAPQLPLDVAGTELWLTARSRDTLIHRVVARTRRAGASCTGLADRHPG